MLSVKGSVLCIARYPLRGIGAMIVIAPSGWLVVIFADGSDHTTRAELLSNDLLVTLLFQLLASLGDRQYKKP